jgi:hypothetical protein
MGPRGFKLAAVTVVLAVVAGITVAVVRATGNSQAARAAAPVQSACAKMILRDWADGRIDGTYPVSCYRDALKSLPADLRVYSSAPDDISQALSRRIQSVGTRSPARTLSH